MKSQEITDIPMSELVFTEGPAFKHGWVEEACEIKGRMKRKNEDHDS